MESYRRRETFAASSWTCFIPSIVVGRREELKRGSRLALREEEKNKNRLWLWEKEEEEGKERKKIKGVGWGF